MAPTAEIDIGFSRLQTHRCGRAKSFNWGARVDATVIVTAYLHQYNMPLAVLGTL